MPPPIQARPPKLHVWQYGVCSVCLLSPGQVMELDKLRSHSHTTPWVGWYFVRASERSVNYSGIDNSAFPTILRTLQTVLLRRKQIPIGLVGFERWPWPSKLIGRSTGQDTGGGRRRTWTLKEKARAQISCLASEAAGPRAGGHPHLESPPLTSRRGVCGWLDFSLSGGWMRVMRIAAWG